MDYVAAPDAPPETPATSDSTASASNTKPEKPPYPPPAPSPTQRGPQGISFDFNLGARVAVPAGKPWRVRLRDLDTGNILFESTPGATFVNSTKRYYLRFALEVFDGDGTIFAHDYNAAGQEILVQFPVGTLGDIMGWFPYAVKISGKAWLPAHLRNVRAADPAI